MSGGGSGSGGGGGGGGMKKMDAKAATDLDKNWARRGQV